MWPAPIYSQHYLLSSLGISVYQYLILYPGCLLPHINDSSLYILPCCSISQRKLISIVHTLIKGEFIRNTTCSEQMVYSAIETTCFGLYWPSSGFYNIEEESINAVKLCGGCWFRESYIIPLTTFFLVQELFVNMEKKIINREDFSLFIIFLHVYK